MFALLVSFALAEPPAPCPVVLAAPRAVASDSEPESSPSRSEMLRRLGLDRQAPAAFQPEERPPAVELEVEDGTVLRQSTSRLREPVVGREDLDLPSQDWR
ncbi:MAG: hypothetical protein KC912_10640 [Proteobacteria bacterium]|nr:hypothetical protein [Pseudomonadota bacterium]